jgi:hypothetical protein
MREKIPVGLNFRRYIKKCRYTGPNCGCAWARDSLELRLDASELVGGEGGGHCNVYSGSNRAGEGVVCTNEVPAKRRVAGFITHTKNQVAKCKHEPRSGFICGRELTTR